MKKNLNKSIVILILLTFVLAACGSFPALLKQEPAVSANNTADEPSTLLVRSDSQQTEPSENIELDESLDPILQETNNLQSSLIEVYQKTNPAVVSIIVPPFGTGSGFVVDEEGYIITNNHVIADGATYEIVFSSSERMEAVLVGRDVDSDLAVLKVDGLPTGIEPLQLGESANLQVGQFVVAIGNPFGEQGSMSLGIISGLGRSITSQRNLGTGSSYSLPQVIQTDAPINPGNSGGPLLNLEGEVIGVNSSIATATGVNSGVGFSIPVDAVKKLVPSLIENGSYDYPYMGAGFDDEVSLGEQTVYNLPQTDGAYVLNVTEGGPAENAGLIAASTENGQGGDLIIKIDDQPIRSFGDLNSFLIFNTTVGQTIDITVLRGEETLVLPLTLGVRPQD